MRVSLRDVDVGDADDRCSFSGRTLRSPCRAPARCSGAAGRGSPGPRRKRRPDSCVLVVDPGVADVRISERDDLPELRRIGEDFLVPGHRRVEHDFADRMSDRADRATANWRAVGRDAAAPAARRRTFQLTVLPDCEGFIGVLAISESRGRRTCRTKPCAALRAALRDEMRGAQRTGREILSRRRTVRDELEPLARAGEDPACSPTTSPPRGVAKPIVPGVRSPVTPSRA